VTLHIGATELSAYSSAAEILDGPQQVDLPVDLLVESTAVLSKKGAGKTSFGVVLAEEAHAAGVPAVIVDPKGDWWGIRSGADGDPAGGLPFVVFGGLHGDLPLEPTAGAYVAELVRSRNLSVLLDVSEFESDAARRRFLTAFADRLYKYDSHEPMVLLLEEAHEYIPQGVTGEDALMVSKFARIVKQGRHKGLGVVMLTQRSASLNKNVLTQIDNLVVLQTTSPQDRDVVKSWVQGHGDEREILASLPSLQPGEFWLWQPGRGEPVHARARMRHTYDSGATPRIGEAPRAAATLADVNLGEIEAAMSDTIERAKGDDPAELRKRIKVLTGDRDVLEVKLDDALTQLRAGKPDPIVIERLPGWHLDRLTDLRALAVQMLELADRGLEEFAALDEHAEDMRREHGTPENTMRRPTRPPQPAEVHAAVESGNMSVIRGREALGVSESPLHLTGYQRDILAVLAQFPSLSLKQIAFRAQKSPKSSTFLAVLPALKKAGYVDGDKQGYTITDAGRDALGEYTPLPQGRALIDYWLRTLNPTEAAMLEALIYVWPQSMSVASLAEATGRSMTSSTFLAAAPALRKWELAHGTKDAMYADDVLGEARDS